MVFITMPQRIICPDMHTTNLPDGVNFLRGEALRWLRFDSVLQLLVSLNAKAHMTGFVADIWGQNSRICIISADMCAIMAF